MLFCLAITCPGAATYERIRSFGFPDQLGHTPWDAPVTGADGALYGTTFSGMFGAAGGVVYRINADGTGYRVVHAFPFGDLLRNPRGGLLAGNDGTLYGTASAGGAEGRGGVFKLNPDGTGYAEIYAFTGTTNGRTPSGKLIVGSDGALYGTTERGGAFGFGTVYKVQPDGAGYANLHHFAGGEDGREPRAGLVKGSDGALYGVTRQGGTTNRTTYGTIFRLNEDGSGYAVLHPFVGSDGGNPTGGLTRGPGAILYGTASIGGSTNRGVVFKLNESGAGFQVIYDFGTATNDVSNPTAALFLADDGFLYGTALLGTNKSGSGVFRIRPEGTEYSILAHIPGPPGVQGEHTVSSLIPGSGGALLGTKSNGGAEGAGQIFTLNPNGSDFAVVRSFSMRGGDVRSPGAGLLRGSDGLFYGTAGSGGVSNFGGIFRFAEGGSNYTLIHSFTTNEGLGPSRLVEALPGVLYGTASSGGESNRGTVFRFNSDGSDFAVLHHFHGGLDDGDRPLAGLMLAADGRLYGTTIYGGIGFGTVYRLNTDGSQFSVVYVFTNTSTGLLPICALVQGTNGALYGTVNAGGAAGRGAVFKMNTDGSDYADLHDFSDQTDGGGFSQAGLVRGPDDAFYGITAAGSSGAGAVFRITQDGSNYSVLHVFAVPDGWNPAGELCVGQDGRLYGATQFGGAFSGQGGVVFTLNIDGSGFSVLHSFPFPMGPEGMRPTGGLVQGSDEWLYGPAPFGGDFSDGVLFRIGPGIPTNNAPTLTSTLPDQFLWILSSFDLTVSAGIVFDRDWGQPLTFSATGYPPGVTFNPATRTFSGVPSAPGLYDITITASDDDPVMPLSVSDTFRLTVALPDLGIARQDQNIVLNWPGDITRFEILEGTGLDSNVIWTSLGVPGGYYIGNRRYTVLPWKEGQWFYRLRSY